MGKKEGFFYLPRVSTMPSASVPAATFLVRPVELFLRGVPASDFE